MTPHELADAAVQLAGAGIAVFPVRADKRPACRHGKDDASSNPSVVRRLFLDAHNAALIARTTGAAAGIAVVDVDPQGIPWMHANMRRLGDTLIDQTPRGGYHLFYHCPDPPVRCSAGKLSFAIDIRGEGGSIIIPPSPGYRTVNEADIADFPVWITGRLAAIDKAREKRALAAAERRGDSGHTIRDIGGLERCVASSRPGKRNSILYWAACCAGEDGADQSAQVRLVQAAMAAGLDAIEAAATVRSGLARGRRGRRHG